MRGGDARGVAKHAAVPVSEVFVPAGNVSGGTAIRRVEVHAAAKGAGVFGRARGGGAVRARGRARGASRGETRR